jgi:uncharacterized RDD family membrane protein YckC
MITSTFKTAIKRGVAYLIDCFLILVYAVILFNVSLFINQVWPYFHHLDNSYLIRHLVSFSTLTLPAILYFGFMEFSKKRASLGKLVMKLEVRPVDTENLSLKKMLLRNAVKLLPWEIAHLTYQLNPEIFTTGEVSSSVVFIGFGFSYSLLFTYMLIVFLRNDGRTLHDFWTNTQVVNKK